MKLVLLMYLEDDDRGVIELLERHGVVAYSRLPVEGHGSGMRGWYGEVAPFRSRLLFTLVPADKAAELLDEVQGCTSCKDPTHPVRAMLVDVERAVTSGTRSISETL